MCQSTGQDRPAQRLRTVCDPGESGPCVRLVCRGPGGSSRLRSQCQGGVRVRGFSRSVEEALLKIMPGGRLVPPQAEFFFIFLFTQDIYHCSQETQTQKGFYFPKSATVIFFRFLI